MDTEARFMKDAREVYWPTLPHGVPLTDLGWSNVIYLADARAHRDPTMVWGTTVDLDQMDRFLAEQSRESNLIISMVHVLIKAVSRSLKEHPRLNRRVIGRRVFEYEGTSIVVPIRRPSDGVVDIVLFRDGESMTLPQVAGRLWNEARERATIVAQSRRKQRVHSRLARLIEAWVAWGAVRLKRQLVGLAFAITNQIRLPSWSPWCKEMNGANALVNFLGFPGAPPMISYKPSSLPTNAFSVSVTMGLPELKPVVVDGKIVIRKIAPVFVRVDHRLVNGHQTGEFIATLRNYLTNPWSLMESKSATAETDLKSAA